MKKGTERVDLTYSRKTQPHSSTTGITYPSFSVVPPQKISLDYFIAIFLPEGNNTAAFLIGLQEQSHSSSFFEF